MRRRALASPFLACQRPPHGQGDHHGSAGVFAGASALIAATAAASGTPAQTVHLAGAAVSDAVAEASGRQRRLLLVFHASWCVYCRLFDRLLTHRDAAPIIERHFEVLHLRAQERQKLRQDQQLAGADDVYHSFAPAGAGLPYMVVLGDGSKKIADSIMASGESFGFPVEPAELNGFDVMLRAGAPDIIRSELSTLRRVCKALIKEKT